MTDEPAVPPTPDGEQRETVTAPAGAALPVPMRVPKHGRGRLLTRGQIGNKGGGRHPQKLVEQCVTVLGLTLDEFERRCGDPAYLEKLTFDELRLTVLALAPYCMPRKYEHAGVDGGPIQLELEAVRQAATKSFRERLGRLQALRPPGREPSTPPPEPRGVASAAL